MTIITDLGLLVPGTDFLDESGGEIEFAFAHPAYTSNHRFRTLPFDSTGAFTAPPGGTTASLSEEADNLASLLRGVYFSDTSVTAIGIRQVLADHTGNQPFPYTFTGTVSGAGTGGGSSLATWETHLLQGHGNDGSKWRLILPGISVNQSLNETDGRKLQGTFGGNLFTLMQYLTGAAVGPVVAKLTNVVTHSGAIIEAPIAAIRATNKRLRRHFRVS